MERIFKAKWNYYNGKFGITDKLFNPTIYKEVVVNNKQFVIIKYTWKSGKTRYKCRAWNGLRWSTFATRDNPRQAINRIKKEANCDKQTCEYYID